MKDTTLIFPDGREVDVSDMTPGEIAISLDAIRLGIIVPEPGETTTVDQFRERLLIEITARSLG